MKSKITVPISEPGSTNYCDIQVSFKYTDSVMTYLRQRNMKLNTAPKFILGLSLLTLMLTAGIAVAQERHVLQYDAPATDNLRKRIATNGRLRTEGVTNMKDLSMTDGPAGRIGFRPRLNPDNHVSLFTVTDCSNRFETKIISMCRLNCARGGFA